MVSLVAKFITHIYQIGKTLCFICSFRRDFFIHFKNQFVIDHGLFLETKKVFLFVLVVQSLLYSKM